MWGIEIAVMLAMIAFNGVFAAYEIALASISVSRLQSMAREGRRGAKRAVSMKESMEYSLAAVQLAITLVGAVAAAVGGAGADENIAPWMQQTFGLSDTASEVIAISCVVVPLTIVTIMFGELVPKVFALRNKEWVCLRLSPFMYWFSFAVHPVVWCLETGVLKLMSWGEKAWKKKLDPHAPGESAELQELRASVALARTSRLIGAREERIILGAAALSQRPVREIMLPAEFISMLNVESSMTDALISAHLDMHSRFPVTERPDDAQRIVGYVNFKDLVTYLRFMPDEPTLRPILRNITSFDEDTPVAQCLERLIRGHAHIALVRDGRDRVVGLVTLEDMIEELVGEIEDEYDRLPAHVEAAGPGWIVGGGLGLAALRERTGIDLPADMPDARLRNVNDWIGVHVDGPVRGGEIIDRPTVRAVVRKSRRQKALEVLLQPKRSKSEDAAASTASAAV